MDDDLCVLLLAAAGSPAVGTTLTFAYRTARAKNSTGPCFGQRPELAWKKEKKKKLRTKPHTSICWIEWSDANDSKRGPPPFGDYT